MSNSSLATVKIFSPNHSGKRKNKVTKIAIHHMAGIMSAQGCGELFAKTSTEASSNYGIGYDGTIGLYVDESNRAWTTSSSWCDNRAVTIEVSNASYGGNWLVSDHVLSRLLDLVYDICLRNGIYPCTYTGDSSGTLQMHKWYAATDCPGSYLGSKFSYIAYEVTKRLEEARNGKKKEEKKVSINMGKVNILVEEKDLAEALQKAGYAVTKEANKAAEEIKSAGKKYRVTADVLNVREKPDISGGIVTTVKENEVYTILDVKNNFGELKSGIGFVSMDYMEEV